MPTTRGSFIRPLISAVGAVLVQGSWALYANWVAGADAATRAGITQAIFSFSATFVMSVILERLFRVGRTPSHGFWIAAVGTSTINAVLVSATHWIAGTPRVLATITPSVAIGTVFYTMYAWGLRTAALRSPRAA